MDIMQEINRMQLHAAFPSVDVDTVNDVLNECNGDAAQAKARLESVFGPATAAMLLTPIQSPVRPGADEPWSPVMKTNKNMKPYVGIRVNAPCTSVPNGCAASSILAELFPLSPPSCVEQSTPGSQPKRIGKQIQSGNRSPSSPATVTSLPPSLLDSLMPAPKLQARLAKPVNLEVQPPVRSSAAALPPSLQYLLSPPPPAAPSPGAATFEPGGWEKFGDGKGMEQQSIKAMHVTASSAAVHEDAPRNFKGVPGDQGSNLDFLQGMFFSMDAALVADVLHGVDDDLDAAIEKLMGVQRTVDHTEVLDSSSGSEDGRSSLSEVTAKQDSGSANGGQSWDVSGVPVDYTFKGLSDEQKVVMIRRELPGCTSEEAMNSLEVCDGNVDAAIAALSQAYERKDPGTAEAGKAETSPELLALRVLFPDVDDVTLGNVMIAVGQDVECAKQMLKENGVQPFKTTAIKSPAAANLFSEPAAAEVHTPIQQPLPLSDVHPTYIIRRRDAHNDAIYKRERAEPLRLKAEMERLFFEAGKARSQGDYYMAGQLKDRAHKTRIAYKEAQDVARQNIYEHMNKRLENHHKVDLHGLHVHEAIDRVHLHARHLCALKSEMTMEVISGRGLHSEKNVSKLMPAVLEYLNEVKLRYTIKPDGGSVIVYIPGANGQPDRTEYYSQDKDSYELG